MMARARGPKDSLALRVAAVSVVAVVGSLGAPGCFVNDVLEGSEGLPCTNVDDCPPTESPCAERTCSGGLCGTEPLPDGTATIDNTAGDCRTLSCKSGKLVESVDDFDDDDGDPCATIDCKEGARTHTPTLPGGPCRDGIREGFCDASGACVVDCGPYLPCPVDPCRTSECVSGACIETAVDGDPLVPFQQVPQDCLRRTCVGGQEMIVPDPDDVPVLHPGACMTFLCIDDAPAPVQAAPGTPCGSSMLVCDAMGGCGTCMDVGGVPSACNVPDIECFTSACNAGMCEQTFDGEGSACLLPDEKAGTCAAGLGCIECTDDDDCPTTPSTCDEYRCINNTCIAVEDQDLTPCNEGNGFCDAGVCVQCTNDIQCGGECCSESGVCSAEACE